MVYKVADIIRDVRIAMDNNRVDNPLIEIEDVDTLELDEIIKSKIEDAVKTIEISAPTQLLDSGHNFGEQLYWNEDGTGKVLLPLDFMRLIVFRMSDWDMPVYTAITETNPIYALQHSRFGGVRGNWQKPVCAIVKRPEGNVLEFYSCKDETATIDSAVYLPIPRIEEESIEICERCYRAIVYQCAGLTSQAIGDEKATTLIELAKGMLWQ